MGETRATLSTRTFPIGFVFADWHGTVVSPNRMSKFGLYERAWEIGAGQGEWSGEQLFAATELVRGKYAGEPATTAYWIKVNCEVAEILERPITPEKGEAIHWAFTRTPGLYDITRTQLELLRMLLDRFGKRFFIATNGSYAAMVPILRTHRIDGRSIIDLIPPERIFTPDGLSAPDGIPQYKPAAEFFGRLTSEIKRLTGFEAAHGLALGNSYWNDLAAANAGLLSLIILKDGLVGEPREAAEGRVKVVKNARCARRWIERHVRVLRAVPEHGNGSGNGERNGERGETRSARFAAVAGYRR